MPSFPFAAIPHVQAAPSFEYKQEKEQRENRGRERDKRETRERQERDKSWQERRV